MKRTMLFLVFLLVIVLGFSEGCGTMVNAVHKAVTQTPAERQAAAARRVKTEEVVETEEIVETEEDTLWWGIVNSTDPNYNKYLEQYPEGRYVITAERRIRLEEREADQEEWEYANQFSSTDPENLKEYEDYLREYPEGLHSEEALEIVLSLKSIKEEWAREDAKSVAMLTKIGEKTESGEYFSYRAAMTDYEKGHVVEVIGVFARQFSETKTIVTTHVEGLSLMDLYYEDYTFEHCNPITVINERVFAMKDDGLELVIEFVELEQYVGMDGFMMRPKFKLISAKILTVATAEQEERYWGQQ